MTTWTPFYDWQKYDGEFTVRGATPPSPSQYRVRLFDGITIAPDMAAEDFILSELQGFGYEPQAYAPGDSVFNSSTQEYDYPKVEVSFAISGQSLQWSAAVLWANSAPVASRLIDDVDPATDRITTIGNHGLSDGDAVLISSDGGSVPGGIGTSFYYAKLINSNTIQLCPDASLTAIVDIGDAGSGNLYLRYAKGVPVSFVNVQTQTIADGIPQSVDVYWSF